MHDLICNVISYGAATSVK